MKKISFQVKKWTVRALVTAGAMLGLSACSGSSNSSGSSAPEVVYGPPPEVEKEIEVVEDVYGPPVEEIDSAVEVVYGPSVEDINSNGKVEFEDESGINKKGN